MKKLILVLLISFAVAGCSEKTSYQEQQGQLYQTSMVQYQDYTCNQINAEMRRISGLIEQQEITIAQTPKTEKEDKNQYLDAAVSIFAIAKGYGTGTEQQATDHKLTELLQRLKRQYGALDQLLIRKNCVK